MPRRANRSRVQGIAAIFLSCIFASLLFSCSHSSSYDSSSLTFLIEANPTNLDPRYATDAQSQRIDSLLFSGLLERDEQMNLRGDLAQSWETPDPLTYVIHLRRREIHLRLDAQRCKPVAEARRLPYGWLH